MPSEPTLFDLEGEKPPVSGLCGSTELPGLDALDWNALYDELNTRGVAVTPPLLLREQCDELVGTFDQPGLFRSSVVMQRHGFGRGTYKYFGHATTPRLVRALREGMYPGMAWMANQWAALLGERTFPADLDELLAECAAHGQVRPTPLILQYGPGGYASLHQDVYGELVFPLQVAFMLNDPDVDFTGGESVFVERQPRAQSRPIVVRPRLGQGVIFPVRHRPVRGAHGMRRHAVQHGTGEVLSGRRTVLGVIFHNAS